MDYAYGEILVLAESEEEAQLFAEAYGGTLEVYYDGLATILLGDATVPQAVKASLSGEYNIPVASPNYYLHFEPMLTNPTTSFATAAPQEMAWSDWVQNVMDDPDPALLYPDSFEYQYQHDVIDTYAAWGVTTGFSNVTVAVIDSGVDGSHPDLNVTQKTVSGVGLTGDSDGHGTHVCGIIAATMNNGLGGAGVAPYINLYSYRISDSSNRMDSSGLYNAIRQAARDGADVINMSLGGYVYDSVLQNAINYAYSYGAVLVAAMGNDGTNVMCYPAACNNVIAVAATDPSNRRAFFSNYGDWCDISAPGVDIFSTYPGSDYAWMSGTSQATPVVTGAIALYLSYNINNSGPANVEKVLKSSATKCSDKGMGAGIVNIANMIDEKPTAPGFILEYNGSEIYDENSYKGQQLPCETTLAFTSYRADEQFFHVYTLDGKTPSVKNGEVVNGTVYTYYDPIDLSSYADSTVTVKVLRVSGMGIPGKVRTIKLKVGESTHISSVNITGPNIMISGKSSQFAATVTPEDTANQGVRWSIRSYTGSLHNASINQKGILSTPSGASGTVTVRATSLVNSNKYADHTVQVQPASPVAKIKLDHTSGYTYVGRTFRLNVTQLEDKLGNSISPDLFGVLWTSSNKKIATVDSNGNVTALAKGKVTITCKSLDGSNKSAKCTVTVKQQITDITITGNEYIAPGSSATLKASVAPSNVTSKSVVWTLASGPSGVSVSSSGKVTVPSYITSGTIQVQATAKDGIGAYNTHTMTIQPKITGNRIEARSSYSGR